MIQSCEQLIALWLLISLPMARQRGQSYLALGCVGMCCALRFGDGSLADGPFGEYRSVLLSVQFLLWRSMISQDIAVLIAEGAVLLSLFDIFCRLVNQ